MAEAGVEGIAPSAGAPDVAAGFEESAAGASVVDPSPEAVGEPAAAAVPAASGAGLAEVEASSPSRPLISLPTPKWSWVLTQANAIAIPKNKAPQTQVARMMSETPPEAPKKPVELPDPKAAPMPPSLPC